MNYIIADARPLPYSGGVTLHTIHYLIALVSRTLRSTYLDLSYLPSTNSRATAPVKLRIGEALDFSDLRTLAAFFKDSPS